MSSNFNYIKYNEADRYSYFTIPKELITLKKYKSMSTDAKFLYGVLRDRNSLSIKNNWFDEEGNVYIFYTREEAQELLNCANKYVTKVFKELQDAGLILEKRQGLGRANIIYVGEIDRQELEQEEKCLKDISGHFSKTPQDISKRHGNNTEFNNTEFNNQSINQDKDTTLEEIYQQAQVELYQDQEVKDSIKLAIQELYNEPQSKETIKRIKLEHIDQALNRMRVEQEQKEIKNPLQYFKKVLLSCILSAGLTSNIFK